MRRQHCLQALTRQYENDPDVPFVTHLSPDQTSWADFCHRSDAAERHLAVSQSALLGYIDGGANGMAINTTSGEIAQLEHTRTAKQPTGASVARGGATEQTTETHQPVPAPATVVSDSLRGLSDSPRNEAPHGLLERDAAAIAPSALPKTADAWASDVAALITSDAELAVLAQAHQLPAPTMPISLDR